MTIDPKLKPILQTLGVEEEDVIVAKEIFAEFTHAWTSQVRDTDVYMSELHETTMEMKRLLPMIDKLADLSVEELQVLYDALPPSPLRQAAGIMIERFGEHDARPKLH